MIVEHKISEAELKEKVPDYLVFMVKLAVDVERKILALGCEFHIDCYGALVDHSSDPKDLWGANVYPNKTIDYISLVNIRPARGNRSMNVENPEIRDKIKKIITNLLFS